MLMKAGLLKTALESWKKLFIHCRLLTLKRTELYDKCYRILGVESTADQCTVRRAYIELVKKVHPDSGLPEASEEQFQIIDEAFKILQEKFAKQRRGITVDEEEPVDDIRHTVPQHRQYLSFDGVGVGNIFQRQKQYQQMKAQRAQDRVLNHRLEKSQAGERTLMKKDGSYFKRHAIKTKYGFDRVVEDLIQEAMSKGDFNNLTGSGKPLTTAQTQNPYLDFTTHKLNKILQDNGFTPEWITLQRDIRIEIKDLKDALRSERAYFGDYPLRPEEQAEWEKIIERYEHQIQKINKSIDKYNLIVPIIETQFFRLNPERLSKEILTDPAAPKQKTRPTPTSVENNKSGVKTKTDLLSFLTSLF